LFSVAETVPPRPLYSNGEFPLVDHFVVMEFDAGGRQTIRLGISAGGIVSQFLGCGQPPEAMDLRNYADDYRIILRGPAYR
jgi:hypothetical protein